MSLTPALGKVRHRPSPSAALSLWHRWHTCMHLSRNILEGCTLVILSHRIMGDVFRLFAYLCYLIIK